MHRFQNKYFLEDLKYEKERLYENSKKIISKMTSEDMKKIYNSAYNFTKNILLKSLTYQEKFLEENFRKAPNEFVRDIIKSSIADCRKEIKDVNDETHDAFYYVNDNLSTLLEYYYEIRPPHTRSDHGK